MSLRPVFQTLASDLYPSVSSTIDLKWQPYRIPFQQCLYQVQQPHSLTMVVAVEAQMAQARQDRVAALRLQQKQPPPAPPLPGEYPSAGTLVRNRRRHPPPSRLTVRSDAQKLVFCRV